MVSCLAGSNLICALTQHELERAHRQEAPTLGVDGVELKAKNFNIEPRRRLQILDRQHTAGIKHARHLYLLISPANVWVDRGGDFIPLGAWPFALSRHASAARVERFVE